MNTRKATNQIRIKHWAEIIHQCQSSGIPAKEWIAQNNISRDAYYYWLHKVKLAALEQTSSTTMVEIPSSAETIESITSAPCKSTSYNSNPEMVIHFDKLTVDVMPEASQRLLQILFRELRDA